MLRASLYFLVFSLNKFLRVYIASKNNRFLASLGPFNFRLAHSLNIDLKYCNIKYISC